jgi:GH24 family phage-related lysozyme (muramidase)
MNLSPLGIALIKHFERYADKAYRRFPKEPWTCGWGHTKGVTETTTCTPEIAGQWILEDVAIASSVANFTLAGLGATQHQFDALVILVYNIGVGNFSRADELHAAIATKQWSTVAAHFLSFDHIDGVENEGLKQRRELEKALFLDGVTT